MDIFTTALGLSKQGNGYELTGFLIEQIEQQFAPKDVAVFEVFGIPGNYSGKHAIDLNKITIRRFEKDGSPERQYNDTNQLTKAINSVNPLCTPIESRDQQQIIMPVMSPNGPLRLIAITALTESPQHRAHLFQIIEFYSSMIALHDSHERDQLTGLHNRQTFNHYYERTISSIKDKKTSMFLAVLDIDHFKRINDTYGHLFGDEVLLQFAHLMEKNFRYNDALFRFGGEEFIALLKCDNDRCAEIALNRFRDNVAAYVFPGKEKITVSIGFVHCKQGQFANNLIGMADNALYYAKEHGRNRVIDFDHLEQSDKAAQGEINLF